MIDNKPQIPGFKSAEDLIGYCELHCKTQRAMFNGSQIKWMCILADQPVPDIADDMWASLHEEMAELCRLARRVSDRFGIEVVEAESEH